MVKVTDELRERVIELRKSGATYQEIEKLTGLRQEQINRILKKAKEEGVLRMGGEEVKEEKVEVGTQEVSGAAETTTETKTEPKKEFPPLEVLNIKGFPPVEEEPKGDPMEPEEVVKFFGEDGLREIKIRVVYQGLQNTPGVGKQSLSALITRLRRSPYLLDDTNNLFEAMREFLPQVKNINLFGYICRDVAEIDARYSYILNQKHIFLPQQMSSLNTQAPQPIFYFPYPQPQQQPQQLIYQQPQQQQAQSPQQYQQQAQQYQQYQQQWWLPNWQMPVAPTTHPYFYPYPYPYPPVTPTPPSPQQDALQKLVERIESLEKRLDEKHEREEKKKEDESVEKLKDEIKELRLRLAGNEEVRRLAEQLKEKERRIEQLEKEKEQREIFDKVESIVQQNITSLKSEIASQISDLKNSIPKNFTPEQYLELRRIGVEEATRLRELDLREQELKAEMERKKSFSEKLASFLDSFGDKIANAVAATVTEEESGEKYETPAGTLQNQSELMMMQCPSCGAPVVFPSVAERIVCPKCEKVFVNPSFEAVPTTTTASATSTTPPTTPAPSATPSTPTTPTTTPALPAEEEVKVEVAKEEGAETTVEETKAEAEESESKTDTQVKTTD